MSTPKKTCGCVDSSALGPCDGRRGETCIAHTMFDRFIVRDARRQWDSSSWYHEMTCPFCGRVNNTGCACTYTYTCDTCGIHSCYRLEMAHYHLHLQTGLICPSTINKRTKAGKRDLAAIAANPALDATTATFQGKRVRQ